MTSRILGILLVATCVVCSSAFARADGNVVTSTKVHQSRRLPPGIKFQSPIKFSKGVASADETASAVAKGQKALDEQAAAAAKAARGADDVKDVGKAARGADDVTDAGKAARGADDVVDVGNNVKVTKGDVKDLAEGASKVTKKKSSKLKKLAKWAGYALLYSLAIFGAYKLVTSGATSSSPTSALSSVGMA